jgi:hypothetical protein
MSQSPFPPDLVTQLRIFAALAQFRLQYDRGLLSKHPRTSVPSIPMPISFKNIPANWRMPLYWMDMESEPVPNEGVVAGEIIGHRCWVVRDNTLWSMVVSHPWAPRRVAEGNVKQYGIHSFKDKTLAMSYANYSSCDLAPVVIGTIKMWGEVIEHERGYRAQYARINSLDDILRFESIDDFPFPGARFTRSQSQKLIAGQDRVHAYFSETRPTGTRDDEQLSKLREIYGC